MKNHQKLKYGIFYKNSLARFGKSIFPEKKAIKYLEHLNTILGGQYLEFREIPKPGLFTLYGPDGYMTFVGYRIDFSHSPDNAEKFDSREQAAQFIDRSDSDFLEEVRIVELF